MQSQLRLNMATTITHKIIPRFKWFPQCEVRPLVEAITKKFTIKDGVHKYSGEKITQTQNPNTPKSPYHIIEIILKRIQKTGIQTLLLLGYDDGWSLLFFSHRHKASFSFSLATLCCQEERKHNLLFFFLGFSLLWLVTVPQASRPKKRKNSHCAALFCALPTKALNLAFYIKGQVGALKTVGVQTPITSQTRTQDNS
jgi:hypothetical protein